MSTIHFDVHELANAASAIAAMAGMHDDERRDLADRLAVISTANTAAWCATYPRERPAVASGAGEIASLMSRTTFDRRQAVATVTGLRYNCVSNAGHQYLEADGLASLVILLEHVARTYGRLLEGGR